MLLKKKKQVFTTFMDASKGDCGVGERVVKEKEEQKEGPASKKRER